MYLTIHHVDFRFPCSYSHTKWMFEMLALVTNGGGAAGTVTYLIDELVGADLVSLALKNLKLKTTAHDGIGMCE